MKKDSCLIGETLSLGCWTLPKGDPRLSVWGVEGSCDSNTFGSLSVFCKDNAGTKSQVDRFCFCSSLCKMQLLVISMHLFVDRSSSRGCRSSSPFVLQGWTEEEQCPAALTHRRVSWTGEMAGPHAQPAPEESTGQVSQHTALHGRAASAPQNGRWGSPARCRAKPVGIPWGKGEVGLGKNLLATPRRLF